MFIGHYGVSLAAKRVDGRLPLGWLFLRVGEGGIEASAAEGATPRSRHLNQTPSGKYFYSVARPMPASSAICDIVTERSPCSVTSAQVVSRIASRTAARRCTSIVSFHSLGTKVHYVTTMPGRLWLTGIRGEDTLVSVH